MKRGYPEELQEPCGGEDGGGSWRGMDLTGKKESHEKKSVKTFRNRGLEKKEGG